jgi:hypothetical protein
MSVIGWTPVYRFPAPFRWELNKRVQFGRRRCPRAVWWTAGRGRGAPCTSFGRRPEPIVRRGPVLTGAECAHFATRGVNSNHPDLADQLRPFSVPFLHVPATEDIRVEAERRQLDLLRGKRGSGGLSSVPVDLARHMQISLSQFVCRGGLCADQHSSFVSARLHRRGAVSEGGRIGGQTYRGAKEGGVKLASTTAATSKRTSTTRRSANTTWCGWSTTATCRRPGACRRRGRAPCSVGGAAVTV